MIDSTDSTAPRAKFGRLLLAAFAVAGFALFFASGPSSAASASYCRSYANEIATRSVPTKVTVNQERRFRRAFEEAYANCRPNKRSSRAEQRGLTAAAPALSKPEQGGACDFTKYAERWMPNAC